MIVCRKPFNNHEEIGGGSMYFRIMIAFVTITMLVSCKSAAVGMENDAEISNPQQDSATEYTTCASPCEEMSFCMEALEGFPCNWSAPGGPFFRLFSGSAKVNERVLLYENSKLRVHSDNTEFIVTNSVHIAHCFSGVFEFTTTESSMTIFVEEGFCNINPDMEDGFTLSVGETITLN